MPVSLPPLEITGLHIPIVALLSRLLADDWEFTQTAIGEYPTKLTAARLKAMGAKPCWPDLSLISPAGLFHALEFKRRGSGRPSPEQHAFHRRAQERGREIATVGNIEAAVTVLSEWGCLTHSIQTRRQA